MKIFNLLITSLLFVFLNSCVTKPYPRSTKVPPPLPTPGSVKKGGPPAHAKAHGYRRKFGYSYYPEKNVYYSKQKKVWYWIVKGGWEIGASLPSYINLKNSSCKQIELDLDTPYEHHKAHSHGHSHPGKGKGKSNGKGKSKGKGKNK
jgi:hypothetical protein